MVVLFKSVYNVTMEIHAVQSPGTVETSSLLITSMGNSFVRVVLFQINFKGFQLIENKLNIRYRAILKLTYDPELKSVVTLLEMPHF